MKLEFSLIDGGTELLDRVEPLWLQLRAYHAELAPMWRESLMATTFAERRAKLISKAQQGMYVLLTVNSGKDVGYCVSTIGGNIGEIDSIFILPAFRRAGAGRALMSRAIEWFTNEAVKTVVVELMPGNHAAETFYAQFGFHPRTLRLVRTSSENQ